MKIKLLAALLIGFCGFGNTVFAQKENNIWYFGDEAGVDFNSGNPVALTNGMLNTSEGCASIADLNGDLLFYTDGLTVWDRNHMQMPNGNSLGGDQSSTQAALIVPFPGNNLMFYIFTTEEISSSQNFSYSVVDISLNSGNGDVTIKNNILISPTAEKLTAVKHANNIDIWVMVHDANANSFYAYLVTTGGISSTPVVSIIGQPLFSYDVTGQMKFSPDGSKIAFGAESSSYVELFDFDLSTGAVTNEKYLTLPAMEYGLEFSANGNYLYASYFSIYQWDVTSNDSATINASLQIIGSTSGGSLQLGPDKKIYVAQLQMNYLGVINNPDSPGVACNYIYNAVSLAGKTSFLGLPNFVTSYFLPTGISNSQFSNSNFQLYPNPATDKIYISFPATVSENITVKIFSITGEVVYEQINKSTAPITKFQIPIFNISNGIYFLSVRTGREVMTRKIVVNH